MSQKFMTDRPTIDEIRRLKKPPTEKVTIVVNSELNDQIEALEQLIEEQTRIDAETNAPDQAPELQAELDELIAEAKAAAIEFEIRALPRRKYDALLEEHQPSDADKAEGLTFDSDTFPPALLAASIVYPELTVTDATEIWEEWSIGESQKLFLVAVGLNTNGAHQLPKSARGSA